MTKDENYMLRAIQLAKCGEMGAAPNPMVGAVIVCDDRIIGEGYHRHCGGPHAEVNAIRSVRDESLLKDSTIYVTLEPCSHWGKTPPCCDMIIAKGLKRVVVGMQDPNRKVNGQGLERIRKAGIEVVVGVLEQECRKLNPCFLGFQTRMRPYVTLKWAQTGDGVIGIRESGNLGNEEKSETQKPRLVISTPFNQMLVHRLRTRCQAIMVGTNTAVNDNPSLTARLWEGQQPLRVTVDRHNRLSDGLHLMDGEVETVIYHNEILSEILFDLHRRGVQHLLVEGGSKLLQSFIDEGLWDDARVEVGTWEFRKSRTPQIQDSAVPVYAPVLKSAKIHEEMYVDGHKLIIYLNSRG